MIINLVTKNTIYYLTSQYQGMKKITKIDKEKKIGVHIDTEGRGRT